MVMEKRFGIARQPSSVKDDTTNSILRDIYRRLPDPKMPRSLQELEEYIIKIVRKVVS